MFKNLDVARARTAVFHGGIVGVVIAVIILLIANL